MANVKLSQIASGGVIAPSTDTLVGVRGGNTDVLLTPPGAGAVTWTYDGDQQITGNTDASLMYIGSWAKASGSLWTLLGGGTDFAHYYFNHNVPTNSTTGAFGNAADYTSTSYSVSLTDNGYLKIFQAPALGGAGVPIFNATPSFNLNMLTGALTLNGAIAASNFSGTSSGTNTGDQTNVSGSAGTVTTINGNLANGTFTTLSGSGTSGSPYTVNVTTSTSGAAIPLMNGANTWSGLQTHSAGIYQSAGAAEEAVYSNGNSGTSMAFNLDNGNLQSVTVTGAVAFTLTAPTHPGKMTIIITQDGTGHIYSISGVKWQGGTTPSYSTALNKIDVASLIYDGTNWYGMLGAAFA